MRVTQKAQGHRATVFFHLRYIDLESQDSGSKKSTGGHRAPQPTLVAPLVVTWLDGRQDRPAPLLFLYPSGKRRDIGFVNSIIMLDFDF
jgi:hypothetical protein